MKNIIDPTITEILNNPQSQELASSKFQNPIPILQQQKSVITTNPYIEPLKEKEEKENAMKKAGNKYKNVTFYEIQQKLSQSCLGFLDDLYTKPDDVNWNNYIIVILNKDDRMNYFAILLIFIVLFFLLIK